jgi:predicted transcriptional regulator of viral defense system
MKNLSISTAVTHSLGDLKTPVATQYHLARIIFHLYTNRSYRGQPLSIQKDIPSRSAFDRIRKELIDSGVLSPLSGFPALSVFKILGRHPSEEEIACSVDPFAYLSHLSAMAHHGLTDRIPKTIFISSPATPTWREFAKKQMEKDFHEHLTAYYESGFPKLTRISMNKIGRKTINRFASLHTGAFKHIENDALRVSTIGRTFLDMIRTPDLCGGIYHVVDIFKENASRYLGLIVSEIDRHGRPIDKIRAGYVLEELCSLSHPTIDGWVAFVQRGGSRKFDPNEEYSPVYSERWCLSINIEI